MRKINLNDICWFMILVGFYIYICYLLNTGRIRYFVHPRMFKYIEFSLFALAVLLFNQLHRVFRKSGKVRIRKGYALFLVPIFLGFVVSPKGINTSMADKKGYVPEQINSAVSNDLKERATIFDYFSYGTVTFNNYEYMNILNDVSKNYDKYDGKNVIIEGFVYRDKNYKENEFVAARFLMACCAADATLVGLMENWDKASTLKNGEWVKVEGRIKYVSKYDEKAGKNSVYPTIDVDRVIKIEKPVIEYIYP